MKRLSIPFLLLSCISLLLCGCTTSRNGITRHYVVGFGIISVNSTQAVATVTKANVLGVYGVSGPVSGLSAGFISTTTAVVKTNSNVLISVGK
jgi:hypothetical protein